VSIKYQEIGRYLRDRISDGTYPPGSKLPSIPTLMEEFDVARDTVRDAVARLAHEGLVTPLRGVGTVVRDGTPVALAYRPDRPAAVWAEQAGDGPQSDRVVEAGWVTPDREITKLLDLPPGSQVVHRIRHQSKGEHIAQLMEQWIPDYVANAIEEESDVDLADLNAQFPTDLFSLMRQAGDAPTTVTERVSTRMPDPDEAALLHLPTGVPVLITRRVTRNASDIPLETAIFTGAGDRMSQSYTVPLK
jgi:GntR family transcriptional regulator